MNPRFPAWFCFVLLCAGSARALDREAFTFTRYELQARIEPEQQRIGVRGKLRLRNDSLSPQKNVVLQISSSLDWRSIQYAGKPVQFLTQTYTSDIDHTGVVSEAIVSLPEAVPPLGTIELEVGYEGVIVRDLTRLVRIGIPEERAKHSDWDQIGLVFTALRGIGYVAWYPVALPAASLADGSSLFQALARWKARQAQAVMKLSLSLSEAGGTEEARAVFCNGSGGAPAYREAGGSDQAETVCSWDPVGVRVPLFVIGDYESMSRPSVDVAYLRDHRPGAENFALSSDLVLPLVSEWFGPPRTGAQAQVVELPDPEAASFETGATLFTALAATDSRVYELTAVHLLTHAFFPSPRLWIDEGLAHFMQALDRERQSGRAAAIDYMGAHRVLIVDAEQAGGSAADREVRNALVNTTEEEFYRSKAMFVWWMLRDLVGEEKLKKALLSYRADEDIGKDGTYLEHRIEDQTKNQLSWFFDDWVYHDRGLPDFRVLSATANSLVGGGHVVSIVVENLGGAGAEVPVIVKTPEGEVSRRLLVLAHGRSSSRIEIPAAPEQIVVNDGSVPESDLSNNTYRFDSSAK